MKAILTYHSLDASGSVISVHPEVFRRHVSWLASGAVRVLPLKDLLDVSEEENAVALTFDDGFVSVAREAAPLLRQHRFPATVFVVTRKVGEFNDWDAGNAHIPSLPLMDWDELATLRDSGIVVEAHGRTHARLPSLTPDALAEEVEGSAEDIERELGLRPKGFAYPYGAAGAPAAERVEMCYDWAVTARLGALSPADLHHRLPRLDMYYYRRPEELEEWGSFHFRRHLWIRRAGRTLRTGLLAAREAR